MKGTGKIHLCGTMFFAITLGCAGFSFSSSASMPRSWGGPSTDYAYSVALDSKGNVYVAGTTNSFGAGGYDVLILKYSSAGTLLWSKTWGGSRDEFAIHIAVGPDGFLYVTGGTDSFGAGWYDIFLLKLDQGGNLKRALTWGGGSYEIGYDIGFDQTGDVYVVGESYSNGNCAVILKFSATAGKLLWSTSWKGPATYDSGYSLVVDSNSNVIIAGISWDYSVNPNHNSILLVKYDSSGNYLWSQNWITPSPGQDESGPYHALATDSEGNIYVGARHSDDCQSSNFSMCDFDAMVLKLDPDGSFLWADTWAAAGYNSAGGVGIDSTTGHLRVSGMQDAFGTPMLFISSYDSLGNLLTSHGWGGTQTISGTPFPSLALDNGDAWIVGGASNNHGGWNTISGTSGTLPNSLVSNPYTLATPVAQISYPTAQMQPQTGIKNSGGGGEDAFLVRFQQ